jgi:hypothetical protein
VAAALAAPEAPTADQPEFTKLEMKVMFVCVCVCVCVCVDDLAYQPCLQSETWQWRRGGRDHDV